jgi:hypothetical protein
MSKDYQIKYTLEVIDRASAALKNAERSLKRMDKNFEKTNKKHKKLNLAEAALLSKNLKYRVSGETKAANQIQQVRQRELSNWARQESQRFRQERFRHRNSLRMEREAARERARIQSRYATGRSGAQGVATRSIAYVSAPTAAVALLSLRNTMSIEQQKNALITQFGVAGGAEVFKQSARYASDTAFSLKDITLLVTKLKVGSKNLGKEKPKDLMQLSRDVGDVMLAYTSSISERERVVLQLGQIATGGKAYDKEDIYRIQGAGVPIQEILESFTGSNYSQLKGDFGAALPAKLIFDAIQAFSKKDIIERANILRDKSLSQGWDSLKEDTILFTAEYGEILSKQFNLPSNFRKIGDALKNLTGKMQETDNISAEIGKNTVAFATYLLMAVPAATTLGFVLSKGLQLLSGVKGNEGMALGARILGRNLFYASGVMSGIYLTTVDWRTVFKDITTDALPGLLKHLDVVLAATISILTTVKAIRSAAGVGLMLKIAGGATAGVATLSAAAAASPLIAAGVAAGFTNYVIRPVGESIGNAGADVITHFYERDKYKQGGDFDFLRKQQNTGKTNQQKSADKIEVTNTIKYDKNDYMTVDTTVKKSPLSNPIIVNDLGM